MKILQIVSLGYVCGGAEKSVLLLKNGLRARGHDVRVLSSDSGPSEGRFSDYEFAHISPEGSTKYLKHIWNQSSYRALKNVIAEFRPDIVHLHTMGDVSPSALYALGNTPAVMTVHGPEEYTLSMIEWTMSPDYFKDGVIDKANLTSSGRVAVMYYRFLQRPFYLLGMRHVHSILAPSKYIASVVEGDKLGVPLQPLYNGIELPKAQPLTELNRILFVGRLERVKGVRHLIDAFAILANDNPKLELQIAGDGRERKHLEQQAKKLKLTKRIHFLGWVGAAKTAELYKNATVVSIPSVWPENLPTVCIEALAVGRPVVGTNTGGLPEMVEDRKTGITVNPADPQALADGLAFFLNKPSLTATSMACTRSAERFSIDTFLANIETSYKEAM